MTIDPFVLLTPILILAIMALVRFVGCLSEPAPPAPQLINAVPGDQMVTLSWEGDKYFDSYNVKRATVHGGPYSFVSSVPGSSTSETQPVSFPDSGLTNGTEYFYVVSGHVSPEFSFDEHESGNSNELPATPEPDVTVTFDNPPPPGNPGDPLNGVYKNLDFGTGGWFWVDPALGLGPANAININSGPNPGAGDIAFANGSRLLQRIRVFPKRVGNVSIIDSGTTPQNPTVAVVYQTADLNTVHFIDTGWTVATQKFTIAADIGFDLDIDTIIYFGPA